MTDTGTPGAGDIPAETAKSPYAAHPVTTAVVTILVAGSILCTLIVPIYASATPKVGDWPFFYFYLLAYMPAVAIALWIATVLQRRITRQHALASTAGAAHREAGQ